MLLTMKFGGTSVGDAARIRGVAGLVKRALDDGHRAGVVTSAMAGVPNRLVALAAGAAPGTRPAEDRVAEFFRATRQLEQDHLEAARGAVRDPARVEEAARALYAQRYEIDRILLGSHLLGE